MSSKKNPNIKKAVVKLDTAHMTTAQKIQFGAVRSPIGQKRTGGEPYAASASEGAHAGRTAA